MVAQQLIRDGRARHSQLGISVADGIAARGTQQVRSAVVVSVAAGQSGSAGRGEGRRSHPQHRRCCHHLCAVPRWGMCGDFLVGKQVNLLVVRDGKELTLSATLASD